MWLEPDVNTDAISCGIMLLPTFSYLCWTGKTATYAEQEKNHADVGRRYALVWKIAMRG